MSAATPHSPDVSSPNNGVGAGAGSGTIRLMLADGPTLVRSALRSLLAEADGIDVVAGTSGRDESVRAAAGHKPDVILYHPPESDKSDSTAVMISALRTASPSSNVVILADSEAPDKASGALLAGAAGYVLKSEDPADLIKAIHRASVASPWISPKVTLAIATAESSGASSLLSEREQQIIQAVALGHTNSEIGEQLHLSVRTVESHRAKILRKLDLSTRAELVNYAITSGLFDPANRSADS